MLSRRSFVQTGLCAGVTATSFTGPAHSARAGGYRALVALWLSGGMDGHDVVIPLAKGTHQIIKKARPRIFADHERARGSREIANLLSLGDTNIRAHKGQRFGLVRELADLHRYFQDGEMAILGSVGPLLEPMNTAKYNTQVDLRPRRLFSHNDQEFAWATFGVEGTTRGWGGAFLSAVKASSRARDNADFLGVHMDGTQAFLAGRNTQPFTVGHTGLTPDLSRSHMQWLMRDGNREDLDKILDAYHHHLTSSSVKSDNYYKRDVIAANTRGVALTNYFRGVTAAAPKFRVPFPESNIGQQLKTIASTIAVRRRVGLPRQMFSAAIRGWDTHSTQAESIRELLRSLNESIVAFRAAMKQIGIWDNVTVFTGADFGRSLVENGSGTDHGWGGHQFILGGAVKGKQIAGTMPSNWNFREEGERGQFVSGRGSLIPSTSVEQYAAALGEWFGLTPAELRVALPNLGAFRAGTLDLFK